MATSVEIVVPLLNEERALPGSTGQLHQFLTRNLTDYQWEVLIADSGSTDATPEIARQLSRDYAQVRYMRLDERGRGRLLRKAWLESDADILAYMDVDLSTDLSALPRLIGAVDGDGYDMAIASRLRKGAQVINRPLKRELISRVYSLITRGMFLTGIRDFQCGFKIISRSAARDLVPHVKDTGWFFDSELVILAEKNGYRIKEMPVRWTDDPDSRVKIVSTAYGDMKGLLRLRFGGLRRASSLLAGGQHGG